MQETAPSLGIFHCPSCEAYFEDTLDFNPTRRCAGCSAPVALSSENLRRGVKNVSPRQGSSTGTEFASRFRSHEEVGKAKDSPQNEFSVAMQEEIQRRNRGTRNKEKAALPPAFYMLSTIMLLCLAGMSFAVFIYFKNRKENERYYASLTSGKDAEIIKEQEIRNKIAKEATAECTQTLSEFLKVSDPSQIGAYITNSSSNVSLRNAYYQTHQLTRTAEAVKLTYINVLKVNDEYQLETFWKWPTGEDRDVVFKKYSNKWLIDWEHMVRYSDQVLAAFASGIDGPDEGIFRVYMRRAAVTKESNAKWTTVTLFEPKENLNGEYSSAPVKISIERASKLGDTLERIHANHVAKKAAFGSVAAQIDPEDLIRVTLRLKRTKANSNKYAISIEEVLSNHWLLKPGIHNEVTELKGQD